MEEKTVAKGVRIKIFIGFALDSVLKPHLYQSDSWKQALITWKSDPKGLEEVGYDGTVYIGRTFPSEKVDLRELRQMEKEIRELLEPHFPDLALENLSPRIFAQTLVS